MSRPEPSSIGNKDRVPLVCLLEVILQSARNHHREIGALYGGSFSQPENSRCDTPPFAAAPIQALYGDDCLYPAESWHPTEQSRAQRVVMNNVVAAKHRVQRAQER